MNIYQFHIYSFNMSFPVDGTFAVSAALYLYNRIKDLTVNCKHNSKTTSTTTKITEKYTLWNNDINDHKRTRWRFAYFIFI